MKTLTIRQVPDDVHEGLRIKAAEAGRSMEEFVRRELSVMAERTNQKPDFTLLEELQRRVAASLPKNALSAAEMVREFRNADVAANEAKWARLDADARAARPKGQGKDGGARRVRRARAPQGGAGVGKG